ncbi:MAG TPA: hypothetical protein VJ963_13735 [Bacteroidales bacterium]|nr:hypothetical protein [Bacteroidales bacterium]
MKYIPLKTTLFLILLSVMSCDEPETVVTDIVHADGSVTRRIEMKNIENKFETSDMQVPFDSTWVIRDSVETDEKGDTTWVKRAEKTFASAEELNLTYKNDSGANRKFLRSAHFSKRFRWFNTEYRFSEKIDRTMEFGYPVSDFLNEEELRFYYAPDSYRDEKLNGADSTRYKALQDSINDKTDRWSMKNLIDEWVGVFSNLLNGKAQGMLSADSLRKQEDKFVTICGANEDKLDSLWTNGILLRELIGEDNATRYKNEADSAVDIAADKLWVDFKSYTVKMSMPGKLTGTNGYIDSSKVLTWPVKSDFFMTEPYVMWAESKVQNKWAWIISGVFLLFVFTGFLIRLIKKG